MNPIAPLCEETLEELCVAWLTARDSDPTLEPASWSQEHVPANYRGALLEVIEASDEAVPCARPMASGQRIGGDFELIHELGSGGFGHVWKARQLSLDRPVALKLLREDIVAGSHGASLQDEGRNLAAVRHPAVVSVYGVAEEEQRVLLAMEWVEGTSLASVLARARRARRAGADETGTAPGMPPGSAPGSAPADELPAQHSRAWRLGTPAGDRHAVSLVRRLADAVGAVHARGLTHGDIKPSNVLLESDGAPRLVDFGLSSWSRGDDATGGSFVGTPDYMAPEDLRDRRIVDGRRSDLWALGAVLFELLTLRRPFKQGGPSPRHPSPPRPDRWVGRLTDAAEFRGDLSPELLAVCRRALAPDPDERYAGLDDFDADLVRFEEGVPVRDSLASPARRVVMALARHRVRATMGLLTAALLASWVVLALLPDPPPPALGTGSFVVELGPGDEVGSPSGRGPFHRRPFTPSRAGAVEVFAFATDVAPWLRLESDDGELLADVQGEAAGELVVLRALVEAETVWLSVGSPQPGAHGVVTVDVREPALDVAFEIVSPGQLGLGGRDPALEDLLGLDPAIDGTQHDVTVDRITEPVADGSLVYLQVSARRPTWLYVLNRGPGGRIQVNFPHEGLARAGFENPLGAGEWRIPLGLVTGPPGEETMLVVADHKASAHMEALVGQEGEVSRGRLDATLRGLTSERLRDVVWPEDLDPETDAPDARRVWQDGLTDLRWRLGDVHRWTFQHR